MYCIAILFVQVALSSDKNQEIMLDTKDNMQYKMEATKKQPKSTNQGIYHEPNENHNKRIEKGNDEEHQPQSTNQGFQYEPNENYNKRFKKLIDEERQPKSSNQGIYDIKDENYNKRNKMDEERKPESTSQGIYDIKDENYNKKIKEEINEDPNLLINQETRSGQYTIEYEKDLPLCQPTSTENIYRTYKGSNPDINNIFADDSQQINYEQKYMSSEDIISLQKKDDEVLRYLRENSLKEVLFLWNHVHNNRKDLIDSNEDTNIMIDDYTSYDNFNAFETGVNNALRCNSDSATVKSRSTDFNAEQMIVDALDQDYNKSCSDNLSALNTQDNELQSQHCQSSDKDQNNQVLLKNFSEANNHTDTLQCLKNIKIKCDLLIVQFTKTLSEEHQRLFAVLLQNYAKGVYVDEYEIRYINLIFFDNDNLQLTPFYQWKSFYLNKKDNLLFYYLQTKQDQILQRFNSNEKLIIYKFFDVDYLNAVAYTNEIFAGTIEVITNAIKMFFKELKYQILENSKNINLPNYNYFMNLCNDFLKQQIIVDKNLGLYLKIASDAMAAVILKVDFQFDNIYKLLHTKEIYEKLSNLCSCETKHLKSLLIRILQNVNRSINCHFPEIPNIITYLTTTEFYKIKRLYNCELYTFLAMLNLLSNISQINLFNVYDDLLKDQKIYNEDYVYTLSHAISSIKYEIFKVLSYCIILFIDEKTYTFYSQIRVLERLYVLAYRKFANISYNESEDTFYYERFNFISRFMFLKELDIKKLFFYQNSTLESEMVISYIINYNTFTVFQNEIEKNLNIKYYCDFFRIYFQNIKNNPAYAKYKCKILSYLIDDLDLKIYKGILKMHKQQIDLEMYKIKSHDLVKKGINILSLLDKHLLY